MKNFILLAIFSLFIYSCEDKIDISNKLKSGKVALVVDAFLNNLPEKQVVKLTSTQYYFDNSQPIPATGATVSLIDLSTQMVYNLPETGGGNYTSDITGDSILKIGHNYQLLISYQEENYVSSSTVNRVCNIDKIVFEQAEKATGEKVPGSYDAEFYAQDFEGLGDRYWVRHYKNGQRMTKPAFLGIGYDASAFPAGDIDGDTFIFPLRRFYINENELEKKWKDGDIIKVELYSITNEAAFYLQQVVTQSSLGQGGAIGALFSTPPSNVPSNIKNTNENGSKAVGFFCTSAVSWGQTTVPNEAYRKP